MGQRRWEFLIYVLTSVTMPKAPIWTNSPISEQCLIYHRELPVCLLTISVFEPARYGINVYALIDTCTYSLELINLRENDQPTAMGIIKNKNSDKVDASENKLPEAISFYNLSKCRLFSSYNVSRNSRHWLFTLLFSLLSTAGISFKLYTRKKLSKWRLF